MRRSLSVPLLLQMTVRPDDYRNVYIEGGRQAGGPMFRDDILPAVGLFPGGCGQRGCKVRRSRERHLAPASADTMVCRRESWPAGTPPLRKMLLCSGVFLVGIESPEAAYRVR